MLRRPSAYSLVVALIVLAGSFAHANEHAETTMHDASAWEHREIHVAFPALPPLEYDIDIAVTIETELQQTVLHMMEYLIQYGNVEGDYNVTLQTDDILSITLRYSGYHNYMAHPAHMAHSLTFDMTTGQRLALADLFQDEQYIDVLSDYITEQIHEHDIPTFEPFQQIAADHEYFQLTPDGLIIYYQPYELAPYAWGFPEFFIPYDDIAHLMLQSELFS